MDLPTQETLLVAACRRFLRPIVRMLIRAGVPYRDFADAAKAAYVEVAARDYGLRGRETNSARIAILTGLSRKEVAKLRKTLAERGPVVEGSLVNPASRVLAAWHQDPAFLTEEGAPRPLPQDGASPSMAELLRRYGGDMPPGALLTELQHVGAARRDEQGRWLALKRYYMPMQLDAAAIERSGSVIEDLAATVAHNLYRKGDSSSRFEGRATNLRVSRKAREAFARLVEEKGEALLFEMDDWLTRHEIAEREKDDAGIRLGLGIYLIEDDRHE